MDLATTLLVAAVIVHDRDAGRVVLLQRGPQAKFGQGRWDLPVGKNDPGEPVTVTAVRELREETGLVVDPADLSLARVIHGEYGVESPGGFLTVVFAARRWTGDLVNAEPAKHSQVRWVDVTELPAAEEFVISAHRTLTDYLTVDLSGTGVAAVALHGWDR